MGLVTCIFHTSERRSCIQNDLCNCVRRSVICYVIVRKFETTHVFPALPFLVFLQRETVYPRITEIALTSVSRDTQGQKTAPIDESSKMTLGTRRI